MKLTTLNRNNIVNDLTANSLVNSWRRKQQRTSSQPRLAEKDQKVG